MTEENNNKENKQIEQPAAKQGREGNRTEDSGKVEVVEGKATPTVETVNRIRKIQQADPAIQTTSEPTDSPASEIKEDQAGQEVKRKAAEAREARAKERAVAKGKEPVETVPKPPSPNQPRLDRIVQIVRESISADAVEESHINENDRDVPTLTIRNEYWFETAIVLKEHPELNLNYMRNISGVDQETHMEVVYHAICLKDKFPYVFKVKTDRDHPSVASVTSIWQTANWNEREIYDLLGIDFPGHPDLRRIMMSDDWIGHPLRKDYEPADPEV